MRRKPVDTQYLSSKFWNAFFEKFDLTPEYFPRLHVDDSNAAPRPALIDALLPTSKPLHLDNDPEKSIRHHFAPAMGL